MSEPYHSPINAPAIHLEDGFVVQPYVEWNEEYEIYEPIVIVYNPNRNHYPTLDAKPFRHMRRIRNLTPEIKAMCSTVFGATHLAMLNADKYIREHYPNVC